jgi:cytochrome c peroxidase
MLLTLGASCVSPVAGRAQRAFQLSPVLGLDELLSVPENNPLASARIAIGQRLFFDSALSRTRSLACASCHRPARAFADSTPRSRGVRGGTGRRNAPAIINRAYGTSFFWDGRAESLESQVLQPIQDSLEMDLSIDEAVGRLMTDAFYRDAFADAFSEGITPTNVARALASYVRTIRSGDAPIDRYRAGDTSALSAQARRGQTLFLGKANCSACHVGPTFSDEQFHNTGVAAGTSDGGRSLVTGREEDRARFKTPTLREVARTAPYMHDGSLATLEEVVDFYNRGGRANLGLDREIKPLGLSVGEKADLVSFLRALSGTVTAGVPNRPRSGSRPRG